MSYLNNHSEESGIQGKNYMLHRKREQCLKAHFFTIMNFSPCLSLKYLLNSPETFAGNTH